MEEGDEFERESRRERAFWFFRSLFSFFFLEAELLLERIRAFLPFAVGLSRLLPHDVLDLSGLEPRRENKRQLRPKLRDSKGRRQRRKRQLDSSSASSSWRRLLLAGCCRGDSATRAAASSSSKRRSSKQDRPWRRSPRSTFGGARRGERERPDLKRGKRARSPIVKQRLSSTTFLLFFYPFSFG